jgi:pimeloyl-ACP methyl ester carboxylesterase
VIEVGCFTSGGNALAYSCGIPPGKEKSTGIIFVHAADGNKLGPHRMFVECANRFNRLGYATLRFDLSGCGDSTGTVSRSNIDADLFDVVQAIRFFVAKADVNSVILFGISRGAYVCYTAMAQHGLPLKAVILLSTPVSGGRAAAKSLRMRLKEYYYKLRDPKHLLKLLSGRANIPQIMRTLGAALRRGRSYKAAENSAFVSKCPVLLFYGGNDPIADESRSYYTARCSENHVPCNCHIIAGGNHSFFHYRWKEQIFDVSAQWLDEMLEWALT